MKKCFLQKNYGIKIEQNYNKNELQKSKLDKSQTQVNFEEIIV